MTPRNVTVVRYTTTADTAEENASLVRDVYDELAEMAPEGFRYATFRLEDGVSFVHVALRDTDENPLSRSTAFGHFQEGLRDRCIDGPVAVAATLVGSYRLST